MAVYSYIVHLGVSLVEFSIDNKNCDLERRPVRGGFPKSLKGMWESFFLIVCSKDILCRS